MSEKEQQSQEATIECEVIEEDYVYKEEAYEKEETYEKEEETYSAVAAKNFFDLTYTKSIEGILRLISIVSTETQQKWLLFKTNGSLQHLSLHELCQCYCNNSHNNLTFISCSVYF